MTGTLVMPMTAAQGAGHDSGRLTITSPRLNAVVDQTGVEVRGTVDASTETGAQINVMFAVDVSGSTTYPDEMDCNGDGKVDEFDNLNADGYRGDVLDCEISGVLAVNAQLRALPQSASNVAVGVTAFGYRAATAHMSPKDDSVFVGPGQSGQTDDSVTPWVSQVLSSLTSGTIGAFIPKDVDESGTEFDFALDTAVGALAERTGPKYLFFLSDGQSYVSEDRLKALARSGISVRTFAVGQGTGSDACLSGSPLGDIATAGKGTCETVTNPADLVASIAEAPRTVESVVVEAPGAAPVTANIDALGNYRAVLTGLSPGLTTLRVRATFKDGTVETDTVSVYAALDKYTYVALGDSYASGEGIEPYLGQDPESERHTNEDFLCHRSRDGWPRQVKLGTAASSPIADLATRSPASTEFRFKACSGAKTVHVDTVQQTKQYRDEPEVRVPLQYDALDPAVDLVTVSLGGNDLDFAGVVKHCATNAHCYDDEFLTAGNGSKVTLRDWSRIRLALIGSELESVYTGIRNRVSDDTTVLATTYPRLISKDQNIVNDLCPLIGTKETDWIWSQIDTFAEVVKYRAARKGVLVADVRSEFDNHLACDRSDSWIYALEARRSTDLEAGGGGWNFWKPALLSQSAATLHPTERGAEAYAKVVSEKLAPRTALPGVSYRMAESPREETTATTSDKTSVTSAGVTSEDVDMRVVTDPDSVLAAYPTDVVAAVAASTMTNVMLGRGVSGPTGCNSVVRNERVPLLAAGFAPGSAVTVSLQRVGVTGEPVGDATTVAFTADNHGVAGGEVTVPAASDGAVAFVATGTNPQGGAVRGTSSVAVTSAPACVAAVEAAGWAAPTSSPPADEPKKVKQPKTKVTLKVKVPAKVRAGKRAKASVTLTAAGVKAPQVSGRVKITMTTTSKASGKKKATSKKVRTVRVQVRSGKTTFRLPKLSRGTWSIRGTYAGSSTLARATSKKYSLKVTGKRTSGRTR